MRPPPASPPPHRSPATQAAVGAEASLPGAAGYGGYQTTPDHPGAWPLAPEFFAEALDAAMQLVHADGGELATLDDSRQRLVLRARRTRSRLEATMGGFGARAPISTPGLLRPGLGPGAGATGPLNTLAEIEQQSTELLPGVLLTRMYRPGERLIGFTWQRGEPVIMRGEECRALPGGAAPVDQDAPWHLAVPIVRPGSFLRPRTGRQIIGVIAVHNRDPHWSFSPADVELLTLHADRVACSMEAAEQARLNEGQAALLEVLRGSGGSGLELVNLYPRVRDVVRQLIDAPSFALLLLQPRTEELVFALAERDGQVLTPPPLPAAAAPRWWAAIRRGRALCISAPEDRAAHPDLCVLGWGGDEPVQSLLAAPLVIGMSLLGAIAAGSPLPDAYAPEQARLFETVARSAAIVIENARLADETRRHLQQARAKANQLAALNNAVLTLNESLDLDATLRALVAQATELTSAQVCTAFLLDDAGDTLVARATNLEPGDLAAARRDAHERAGGQDEVRIPLAWRNLGTALTEEHFLLLEGLQGDWDESPLGRLLAAERVQSALVVPVVHQGYLLGALAVYTPGQRHHFPAEEIVLLQGLASQAAVAISNARLYQQLERAYEQQKELDRYKDEFILTVSHEFRTPLTAINGYLALIERHGDHLPREKLAEFAEEIRTSTGQLASMISMLADANRMGTQPLTLTLSPVNLREVAEIARKQQPPEVHERVDNQVPAELWVPADAERLRLVFSNLISNAVKYSPAQERCTLTAGRETREALTRAGRTHAAAPGAADAWIVASVIDRGEGIKPSDQARLFQKFVRLTHSLTTSVRGTGLGLWICRQYVEAMKGDIWVESAIGQGSTFRFCLPAATAPPRQ
jgi:signal transduction histidine kinase